MVHQKPRSFTQTTLNLRFLINALRSLIIKMQIRLLWKNAWNNFYCLNSEWPMQELFEKWIEQSIFSASFLVTIWKWKVEMTPRQNFFDWCCLKIVKKNRDCWKSHWGRQATLYIFTTSAVKKFNWEQELNPALIASDGIDICWDFVPLRTKQLFTVSASDFNIGKGGPLDFSFNW